MIAKKLRVVLIAILLAACKSGQTPAPSTADPFTTAESSPALTSTGAHIEVTLPPATTTPQTTIPSSTLIPSSAFLQPPDGAIAQLGIGSVNARKVSPNGAYLLVEINGSSHLYRTDTLDSLWMTPQRESVIWLDEGERIGIGAELFDSATGQQIAALPLDAQTVAWSPGASLASTYSDTGDTVIWDVPTGRQLWRAPIPTEVAFPDSHEQSGWVVDMAFSPDGQTLALAYTNPAPAYGTDAHEIYLYEARTGTFITSFDTAPVYFPILEWSATSTHIAMYPQEAWESGVTVWNVETRTEVLNVKGAYSAAFASHGCAFAVAFHNTIDAWDCEIGYRIGSFQLPEVGHYPSDVRSSHIVWSPDRMFLAAEAAFSPHVFIWNTQTLTLTHQLDEGGPLVGFGSDSQTLIAGTGAMHSVAVWQLSDDLAQIRTYVRGYTGINSLVWSPDGSHLANTFGILRDERSGLLVWEVASRAPNLFVDGTSYPEWGGEETDGNAYHIDWSRDGWLSFSAIADFGVALTSLMLISPTEQTLLYNQPTKSHQAEFSPDGSLLAVRYYEFHTEYTPEGRVFSQTSQITILHTHDGSPTGIVLKEPQWEVTDAAWSPDGTQIAMALGEHPEGDPIGIGQVSVWDAASGQQLYVLEGIRGFARSVTWSPDGTQIAAGTDTGITVWAAGASKPAPDLLLHSLIEREEPSNFTFMDVDWSPDGSMIAGAYGRPKANVNCAHCSYIPAPGAVMVWDALTAERLYRFDGHTAEVQAVAFSPDGSLLASSSLDGTILLWDVSP